jgi:hypothetical protein
MSADGPESLDSPPCQRAEVGLLLSGGEPMPGRVYVARSYDSLRARLKDVVIGLAVGFPFAIGLWLATLVVFGR